MHGEAHLAPTAQEATVCRDVCSHCASESYAEALLAPDRMATLSAPHFLYAFKAGNLAQNLPPALFAEADFAGGWRDPPPQTPVTLRTRLLN